MLGCWEHVHIHTDFRNHGNGGKDIFEGRNSQDQVDFIQVGFGKGKDDGFQVVFTGFKVFIVLFNDLDFPGLLGRDRSLNREFQFRKFPFHEAVRL
ncbi:hypothetical protein D3C74_367210 [compost metagenome]